MHSYRSRTNLNAEKLRGMTLIEILVVMGIVALLAAMLFPTISGMRKRARRIQCASNLRQIGVAVKTYLMDNNNQFVDAVPASMYGEIADEYRDYAKGVYSIFRCPAQNHTLSQLGGTLITELPFPSGTNHWTSYEFNTGLAGAYCLPRYIDMPSICAYAYDILYWDKAKRAHDTGMNVLYVDWHVSWLDEADFGLDGTNDFYRRGRR